MNVRPIEWMLVIYYGLSAHRAIYGRLPGSKYTKDFIQLSRLGGFVTSIGTAFPSLTLPGTTAVPIKFRWPGGSSDGTIFERSSDRPHLAWEFSSAPLPWRMHPGPTRKTVQTILGDPSQATIAAADGEYHSLASRGVGQPYLIAVKLRDETDMLHLRVCLAKPSAQFSWADLSRAPVEVQRLAAQTSARSALAWQTFDETAGPKVLCFDPDRKTNPWSLGWTPSGAVLSSPSSSLSEEETVEDMMFDLDSVAEELPYDDGLVSGFEGRVTSGDFSVPDAVSSVKVRGSAQRIFSRMIKHNYGWRCALTGIDTRDFLVASHIVPWSADETIRLDPANGICLSVLVDRAFEKGFLIFEDDLTVRVNWEKVGADAELRNQLKPYDGSTLATPSASSPNMEYLRRRRIDAK